MITTHRDFVTKKAQIFGEKINNSCFCMIGDTFLCIVIATNNVQHFHNGIVHHFISSIESNVNLRRLNSIYFSLYDVKKNCLEDFIYADEMNDIASIQFFRKRMVLVEKTYKIYNEK